MRRYAIPEPYEKLKEITRDQEVTQTLLHEFIRKLDIPDNEKSRLLELTPATYTGLAASLAKKLN
jgi:adenylosuccinate lyase